MWSPKRKSNKNKDVIVNTIYCLSRVSFHFHRFESALRITVFVCAFISLSRSEMPESQFQNESICRWECWQIFSREIEKHQENAIKNLNETKTFKEFHCDSHDFFLCSFIRSDSVPHRIPISSIECFPMPSFNVRREWQNDPKKGNIGIYGVSSMSFVFQLTQEPQ